MAACAASDLSAQRRSWLRCVNTFRGPRPAAAQGCFGASNALVVSMASRHFPAMGSRSNLPNDRPSLMKSLVDAVLPRRRTRRIVRRTIELEGEHYWILRCGVDGLAEFENIYGRAAADEALRQIRGALFRSCRRDDRLWTASRGEYAISLCCESLENVLHCAEWLRAAVEALQIPNQGSPLAILTISVGISTTSAPTREDARDLTMEAEAGLERARRHGRNQVALAPRLGFA